MKNRPEWGVFQGYDVQLPALCQIAEVVITAHAALLMLERMISGSIYLQVGIITGASTLP